MLKPGLGASAGTAVEFALVTAAVVALGLWLARGWPAAAASRLARGAGGVAVLLALESGLALGLLGQPLDEYLKGFDIGDGALLPYGLTLMALAPLVARRR